MNVIDTLKAYVKMDARRQWLPAFTAFRMRLKIANQRKK